MTLHRKTYWFHGIQARISFILLLTTTLIFSGFMVNYYHSTRDQMNSEIDESGDFFANHLSISLAKPLWDTDANAIEGVLEATMKEKQVYAIFIRDNLDKFYGKIRDAQWRSIPLREDIFPEESVRKQKEVVWQDEMLGTVQVCLTPKFMQKKLNEAIADMLITLAVLDTLLFLLLFFSIRKIIILPIRATASYLRNISLGVMPEKINGQKYRGEFEEIRNSLLMLVEAINQTVMTAEGIAAGNLTAEVRERSAQDRMMQALNRMTQRLNDIMNETERMIQSVGQGRLDIRGNAETFEGGWAELITGVNDLIAGLSSAVSEKAALGTEMELAKQIQTVLLPEKPEISGYEIVASLEPAEEVGGDYYDVISVAGYDWIVIGDVSGHGLTAGLVMMMVQTAIHTVLLENPAVSPSALLTAVNWTIYENIARMNEAKHVTIVVLAAKKDGTFSFSGLHEDILIWRAADRHVEKVETDGMWIGLEPDISEMLSVNELKLEQGDCLVLYTDGITEAWSEDGKMFGDKLLASIVESAGGKSAAEIHADIIGALKDYEKPDDVTLFVMKRV
jgi:serine phosphatase RsbU (regulator of sigma subunit)